jgi:hypothetical protein
VTTDATNVVLPDETLHTRRLAHGDVSASHGLLDAFAAAIATHGTLYDWASLQPQPRALRGRAPVFVAMLPDTEETVVVRHGWHGGLFAPVTGDRFRHPTRAPREFAHSSALRAAGIPTTTVLGFARYRAGFGMCRVDVVSRFVPDAFDLGMIAAALVPQISLTAALEATLHLLHRLALAGVVHPDLNVKNVLLTREASPSSSLSSSPSSSKVLQAMVIDIDVVQWQPQAQPQSVMQRNVTRLVRSMRKWRTQFGCDLTDVTLDAFTRDAMKRMAGSLTP